MPATKRPRDRGQSRAWPAPALRRSGSCKVLRRPLKPDLQAQDTDADALEREFVLAQVDADGCEVGVLR